MGNVKRGLGSGVLTVMLLLTTFGVLLNVPMVKGMNVGGIINEDTIWTRENSPYVITETVQVPSGVTLTIEPGVTVSSLSSGSMFLLNGIIYAHGAPDSKIIFDGGGNSVFFNPMSSDTNAFLDLDYTVIKNGRSFWPVTGYGQYGLFSLTHSELTNITGYSYVPSPAKEIYVEYNRFTNTAGFSVANLYANIYIRYNLFKGNSGFVVENWASYGESETIVKYNSFIDMEGTVLDLPSGYNNAAMVATENYWGTLNTTIIDSMIYDKNDDITCAGYIEYLPILSEPHPDTPEFTPPTTTHDYDDLWHVADFTIALTATDDHSGVAKTYYRINDGPTKTVDSDGQPLVTAESANNKLEYWSIDKAGNEEIPHKTLTEIKLDKTAPVANPRARVNAGTSVTFYGYDSTDTAGIVSYEWNFGDGAIGTGATTTHTYAGQGTFTVTLTVEDAAGNTATDTTTVTATVLLDNPLPLMWMAGVALAAIGLALAAILFLRRRK